jgi:outer membrane protein insertion porin family
MFKAKLLVTGCFFLVSGFLFTADASPIQQIVVSGNQRVDTESVKSYLTVQEGEEMDEGELSQSIKSLFATNLFSDVNIGIQGSNVIVEVTENPIISQVVFEGNKTIDDEQLAKEVTLQTRSIYTKSAVQSDVQRIAMIYSKSGKYNATVEPKVILKDQNRVDLVYEITEGKDTEITKIVFIGNKEFSDSELKSAVQSSETAWYKFFSNDDKYDADRIEYDRELLRRFYTKNGFADFEVRAAVSELNPEKDGFALTYSINEGPKYNFGKVQLITQLTDLKSAEFEEEKDEIIRTKEGDEYDSSKLEKTVDNLVEKAGEKGFAFVDVDPQISRDTANKIIDVTYVIKEGPKVYVDRINIGGNSRTLDEVVRRELRVSEGDPFNTSMVKRSKQRIENLDFFKKVDISQERGDAPDKVNLNVAVEEKSTGEVNFGAGYSTVDGVLGEVSISERNFLGRGQNVRASISASTRRQEGQLSFTEPYFMGEDMSAGFDIYKIKRDFQTESSYDSDSAGLNLRTGYDITEHTRHSLNYKISNDKIANVDPAASLFIKQQEGTTLTSLVGHDVAYDTRDNINDPVRGYLLKAGQDFAGLGGDVSFLRHELTAGYYVPLDDDEDFRLQLYGNAGTMFGMDEDIPINQRFFVGGRNFRGFDRGGIGPRDKTTKDALGGNNYYIGSVELGVPLGLPDDLGVRGAFFSDVGSLWGVDDTGANVYDNSDPRVSVGFGVGWASPFGPIRIDIASPIVKDDLDETQPFQFNFGTRF